MAIPKKPNKSKIEKARKAPTKSTPEAPAKPLKLWIEKVPKRLWRKNLRSEEVGLGKHRWDKLRKAVLEANGPACTICGDTEKPHGHEVWEYREAETGPCVARALCGLIESEDS